VVERRALLDTPQEGSHLVVLEHVFDGYAGHIMDRLPVAGDARMNLPRRARLYTNAPQLSHDMGFCQREQAHDCAQVSRLYTEC
jgi:hypothetical protein